MTGLNMNDERCEALFASALQRSDLPTAEVVADAITEALGTLGSGGCACRMAEEYGNNPEAASERMRWARQVLGEAPDGPPAPASANLVGDAA
jgi:hypothetical protein